MGDSTYQPKVYRRQGGDVLVIAAGGMILAEPGGSIMAGNPTGAADYFVDLNVAATGSGSMQDPFATIAEAIAASNISIALTVNRWWARRNRIFVMGDGIDEDLTVLPEKCDIIGCGADLVPFPRVIGHHTIAAAKVGCRFINMGFIEDAGEDLLVIPAGCHGLQFIGGMVEPAVGGSTKAFEITSSAHVRIDGVSVGLRGGDFANIFGVGISIEGTVAHDTKILNCPGIFGTIGIQCAAGLTAHGSVIDNNIIRSVGQWIDDDSDDFIVTNNRGITDIDCATYTAGFDFNLLLAAGNIQTGSNAGDCDTVPHLLFA